MFRTCSLLLITSALAGCAAQPAPEPILAPPAAEAPAPQPPPAPKAAIGTFGFDTTGMDRSVAPGEANLRQRLLTDPHAPAIQRAWIVRNFDPWYPALNVQAGQKLYLAPEARVRIW